MSQLKELPGTSFEDIFQRPKDDREGTPPRGAKLGPRLFLANRVGVELPTKGTQVSQRGPRSHGTSAERHLFNFVKDSGVVDVAFGGPTAVPPDPLDDVLAGIATAFGEHRPSRGLVGRLKDAARRPAENAQGDLTPDQRIALQKSLMAQMSPEELAALREAVYESDIEEMNEAAVELGLTDDAEVA